MIKFKPLKIVFESLRDFKDRTKRELKETVSTGKTFVDPEDILRFDSVATYQQIMSDNKYAILAAIYKHKPRTVYQLAKILDRPIQNITRDCDILEGHGFIVLEKNDDARKSRAPRLAFDYNAIVVYMPQVTYKVDFEDVAA